MADDDVLDLTAAERTLRKLADDAREAIAAGRRPDDLFECYRLVVDELDRLRARLHALEGEGPRDDDGRHGMRTATTERAIEQLGHLNLWWSPTIGLIRGAGNAGYDDAVPLVPAEPVDEKSRGEAYMRGHRDGQLAERAAPGTTLATASPDQLRRFEAWLTGDEPPFAPELADAPLVTGQSGALAPMVVDQPVHDSTLPAELASSEPHAARPMGPPLPTRVGVCQGFGRTVEDCPGAFGYCAGCPVHPDRA